MNEELEEQDKVYVLLPVHNGAKTIERSINSVFEQKNVADVDYRLCVVLNMCTDNTEEIINSSKYRDRIDVLNCDIKGIVPALNAGLRHCMANGATIIARQDADDRWHHMKLSQQVDYLEAHPDIDICGTSIVYVKPDTYESIYDMIYPEHHDECVKWILNAQNPIAHPSVIYRTRIFDRCGGYDNSIPLAEDLSLWIRAISNGYRLGNIQRKLVEYTFIPNPRYNPIAPQILGSIYMNIMEHFGVHKI